MTELLQLGSMSYLQLFKSLAMVFYRAVVSFCSRRDGGVGCPQFLQFPQVLICFALFNFNLGLNMKLKGQVSKVRG